MSWRSTLLLVSSLVLVAVVGLIVIRRQKPVSQSEENDGSYPNLAVSEGEQLLPKRAYGALHA